MLFRSELARAEVRTLELAIGSEVAVAAASARSRLAELRLLREQALPALEEVVAQTQAEYNFMLESPFELLKGRQAQLLGYQRYLETLRDYWLAWSALASAVGTALPEPLAPTRQEVQP